MILTKIFNRFFESERAAGLTLVVCTLLSLTLANILPGYVDLWHVKVADHTLVHWINDGLMAIFFLMIGLELEREIYGGELSSARAAMLPVSAALGGIVAPLLFYTVFNYGTPLQSGAGIPMATDIAFAVGILSLLGNRVPGSLKIRSQTGHRSLKPPLKPIDPISTMRVDWWIPIAWAITSNFRNA